MKTNPDHSVSALHEGARSAGLIKREYFAAIAMQGFVMHYSGYVECNFNTSPSETAEMAVKYADALIDELNKEVK